MRLHPNSKKPRGIATLAVIWLIAFMMIVMVTAVKVMSFQIDIADSQINGFRARQNAEVGIAVAANPAVKRDDPILHQSTASGSFTVDIRSEGERFDINNLLLVTNDKKLLKELFMQWGLEEEDAQPIADSLKDWVDQGDEHELEGAEKDWYEEQGRINQPFNRPFYNLDEMRLVRGMDIIEQIKPDWREWFTVWTNSGLDINEADSEKIAFAAECNVEDADLVVEMVRGADGIRGTEDDSPFQSLNGGGQAGAPSVFDMLRIPEYMQQLASRRLTTNSSTNRIESIGTFGDSKRKIILILRNRTGRPTILEKKEEIVP